MVHHGRQSDGALIRVAGHFGELMQGRLGPAGPVALITLPCPALAVVARHQPGPGFTIDDGEQGLLSLDRAQRFLKTLDLSLSGQIKLHAEMPVGGGAGASTAALVALARVAGYRGACHALAAACIASEGASDPVMFAHPVQRLWASRIGQTLADLPPLPRFAVIGGFFGPPHRTDSNDSAFPDITAMIPQWVAAAQTGDLPTLATLASLSANRTLRMRQVQTDPTAALANQLGALGHVIAHTGSARGLIFSPGAVPVHAKTVLQDAGLDGVVEFLAGGPP